MLLVFCPQAAVKIPLKRSLWL
uniref:Uncharacterized protein n=1 Tax=Arundo donax TaxID=35708 RepID=A0A0A9GWS3_ARUDO